MKTKIGIVGHGFVGSATRYFSNSSVDVFIYDRDDAKCSPPGTTIEVVAGCKIVFVCVPTPMATDGSCSTRIVESVIASIREHGDPYIIVRSTVPIGFCARHKVAFMPEFLTEARYIDDFRSTPLWIIGNDHPEDGDFTDAVDSLIRAAHADGEIESDKTKYMPTRNAEMLKYFRNCFLATKVAFCNEVAVLCARHNIDYNEMASHACSDARIGHSHRVVPGPDGRRGFGGSCFPKDVASLIAQCSAIGCESPVLSAVMDRNVRIDRCEQDWKELRGRAVEED